MFIESRVIASHDRIQWNKSDQIDSSDHTVRCVRAGARTGLLTLCTHSRFFILHIFSGSAYTMSEQIYKYRAGERERIFYNNNNNNWLYKYTYSWRSVYWLYLWHYRMPTDRPFDVRRELCTRIKSEIIHVCWQEVTCEQQTSAATASTTMKNNWPPSTQRDQSQTFACNSFVFLRLFLCVFSSLAICSPYRVIHHCTRLIRHTNACTVHG